ncbi:MAG: trypsin-like peptidase domain-containing protein [Thermoguttaceae bacterium]|nr:trypsin-like peptidase domain-containing protein [Thermoguttaceae bacterium]
MLILFVLTKNPAFSQEFRRAATFEDAHGASCRVNAGQSRGTGTFFGAWGGVGYVLTNYHVVTKETVVSLDFWTNSIKETISGKVVWKYFDPQLPADFAIIAVDAETLKNTINPPFVPLAGNNVKPSEGGLIVSSGAPDGRFTQAWKGQVLDYYKGATVLFSPPPVPGQSGSGIVEHIDGGLFVTGILTWLIGEKGRDDSKGGAIPIANLYEAARRGKRAPTAIETGAPIPPNATECSETVKIVYYAADDCPGCQMVKDDVDRLEREGAAVERVDAGTESGKRRALAEGIREIPAVVVVLDGNRELIQATEILADGLYQAVNKRTESNEAQNDERAESLWTRPKVREDEDAISGILNESESFWERRGRREPAPEPPTLDDPETPPTGEEPTRIGDRIADRIAGALESRIEREAGKLVDKLEGEIQKKIDATEKEIKNAIVGAINEKIKRAWTVVKRTALVVVLLVVASLYLIRGRKKSYGQQS